RASDEPVPFTPDDDSRLRELRQAFFDAIAEREARCCEEWADARLCVVPRGDRKERERLAGRVSQRGRELMAGPSLGGVERGTDPAEWSDARGPSHRELGDDLAAERVCDDHRANQSYGLDPASERVGERREPEALAHCPAPSLPGEIGSV